MKNKRLILAALLMVVGGIIAALTHNHTVSNKNLKLFGGTYLHEHSYTLPEFALVNHHNVPFTNKDLTDKWSFLFFGYTHCPDICPITLSTLNEVTKKINDQHMNANPQVLFVSVDEQRDTPLQLSQYVTHFNPSFIGLTGNKDAISALTKKIGVAFSTPNSVSTKDYVVDHSTALFLINPNAQMVAVFSSPHNAKIIAKDFLTILRASSS